MRYKLSDLAGIRFLLGMVRAACSGREFNTRVSDIPNKVVNIFL
jgi:hypothetical protein